MSEHQTVCVVCGEVVYHRPDEARERQMPVLPPPDMSLIDVQTERAYPDRPVVIQPPVTLTGDAAEHDAGTCPTCGSARCVGRLDYEWCGTTRDELLRGEPFRAGWDNSRDFYAPYSEYSRLCQRIRCEHTAASHLNGPCDWCDCERFLDPDHDDEPESRQAQG